MHLSRIWAAVGTAFGAVFVFVNAGGLPGAWPTVLRTLGVLLVLGAVWSGVVRQRVGTVALRPGGVRVYWLSVLGELVAIPLGAAVINQVLGRPELTVVWVVFVVGAHFLPAMAFGHVRFAWMGGALMTMAVAGTAASLLGSAIAAPATAVGAGVTLLAFSASAGRLSSPRVDRRAV